MTNYSNPRMEAVIENWPSGARRVTAEFHIETIDNKVGHLERAVRVTTGKPVKLTYARRMRIVDGDDGRTYIVAASQYAGGVVVWRGDMKVQEEIVFHPNPRYHELMELFKPPEPIVNLIVTSPDGKEVLE